MVNSKSKDKSGTKYTHSLKRTDPEFQKKPSSDQVCEGWAGLSEP
jgi:hypothetical protein